MCHTIMRTVFKNCVKVMSAMDSCQRFLVYLASFIFFNRVIIIASLCLIKLTTAARLHKIFQFIDGFRSEHSLIGFLHIGIDYAILLRAPKPHSKYLIYELYEAKNIPDIGMYKPRLLAISKVPVDYMRDQLKIYRTELYNAKYLDDNVVPGTQVLTLREWQIERALNFSSNRGILNEKMPILRTIM